MNGTELLNEFKRRIQARDLSTAVTDTALAKELGITPQSLANYRGRDVTVRQMAGLMEKFAKQTEKRLIEETLVPLVEFLPFKAVRQGRGWQIFSTMDGADQHPYFTGLKDKLEESH